MTQRSQDAPARREAGAPQDHRAGMAWLGALAAFILLVLSLSGDGTGPMGLGMMTHAAWSFILAAVLLLFLLRLAAPRREAPP